MPLLTEYALTPDVFDVTSYTSEEVTDLHLRSVKDVLLSEGLVRNLREGEWANLFSSNYRPWHQRGKELITKLALQKRLIPHQKMGDATPSSDTDWCDEALDSHRMNPLGGIIVTNCIAPMYSDQPLVAPIHKLTSAPWWAGRSPSVRLCRTFAEYNLHLDLILRHVNSIMFIDPHIDPSLPRYQDFIRLVQLAGNRTPAPIIEVHRVCYRESGLNRQILDPSDIEARFRNIFSAAMRAVGLIVEVFVWDDFHDRHIISDLVGISLQNGFDTTNAVNVKTTWTRLGRQDRDDIQREFDPASNRHKLRARFHIP